MGINLREASSGRIIRGTTVNQFLAWNNTTKLWEPDTVNVSPGFGALTRYVFWDASTTVPLAQQDGSIQKPFQQLQAAVSAAAPDASGGNVFCVGAGDVTQTFTFDGFGVNTLLNLVAYGGFNNNTPCQFGTYTLINHAHVVFQGVSAGIGTVTNTRLWTQNCILGGVQMSNNSAFICSAFQGPTNADNSNPWSLDNSHFTDSAMYLSGMRIGGNVVIDGTSVDCQIKQCQFESGGHVMVVNGTSSVAIDLSSMATARANGYNLSGFISGLLTVFDAPTSRIVGFPNPAAAGVSTHWVTVAMPGAMPGDTFACSLIDGGLGPPANWSIGPAYSQTPDNVTIPVIYTAADAGSTSYDVNCTRFTVAEHKG